MDYHSPTVTNYKPNNPLVTPKRPDPTVEAKKVNDWVIAIGFFIGAAAVAATMWTILLGAQGLHNHEYSLDTSLSKAAAENVSLYTTIGGSLLFGIEGVIAWQLFKGKKKITPLVNSDSTVSNTSETSNIGSQADIDAQRTALVSTAVKINDFFQRRAELSEEQRDKVLQEMEIKEDPQSTGRMVEVGGQKYVVRMLGGKPHIFEYPFEITERTILGIGGEAVVVKAKDIFSNTVKALKVVSIGFDDQQILGNIVVLDKGGKQQKKFRQQIMQPSLALASAEIRAFRHECALIRTIDHPNVQGLVYYKLPGGNSKAPIVFAEQELASEGSLDKVMDNNLSLSQRLDFINQIMEGASFLHQQGIWHRDFKLLNILVFGDQIRITDFGNAVRYEAEKGPLGKTSGYFSRDDVLSYRKEKSVSEKFMKAYDTFALGVTFYKMLTSKDAHPYPDPYDGSQGEFQDDVLRKSLISMGIDQIKQDRIVDLIARMVDVSWNNRLSLEEAQDAWLDIMHLIMLQEIQRKG